MHSAGEFGGFVPSKDETPAGYDLQNFPPFYILKWLRAPGFQKRWPSACDDWGRGQYRFLPGRTVWAVFHPPARDRFFLLSLNGTGLATSGGRVHFSQAGLSQMFPYPADRPRRAALHRQSLLYRGHNPIQHSLTSQRNVQRRDAQPSLPAY